MTISADKRLLVPTSLSEALVALKAHGRDGAPLAGATWISRAPFRGEERRPVYVCIARIEALRAIEVNDGELRFGACATHAALAAFLEPYPEFRGLRQAAANSANPAVRNMATVGGNLCTADFPAADLVPALLCFEAEVELQSGADKAERMTMSDFLTERAHLSAGTLLTQIAVRRKPRRSAHVRLPLRKAGDYPVAIVSVSCPEGEAPRIAIGSVEPTARRWHGLEEKLGGGPLDSQAAAQAAAEMATDLSARDGVEAPGWYRLQVLPALLRRAMQEINQSGQPRP